MARIGAHSFRGSHLSGGAKGVTALLADLKAVAEDGGGDILNVTVGNYNWGSTATAKLLQLVPKLEVINLMNSKKVSQHHNLMDWTAAKFLKSFTYECDLRFTDGGILTLLSGCPMLTDLTLSTVTIFHKTLSVVSLGAPGLAALNKARAARGLRVSISGYVVNEDNELVKATMSLKRPAPVSTEALIVD